MGESPSEASTDATHLPFINRAWVSLENDCASATISIATWNILADCYASRSQHPQCPAGRLSWTHRLPLIIAELSARVPDVICLQELDRPDEMLAALQPYGYNGVYRSRLRDSNADQLDGCGIYWREQKVQLILKRDVMLDDVAYTPWLKAHFSSTRAFLRKNIAIFCLFEGIADSNTRFVVANTHLYWDPNLTQVKLAQATYLLRRLERFIAETRTHQVVLLGDFNSLPESAVYELTTRGRVSAQHPDVLKYFGTFDVTTRLRLHSAYSGVENPCTNWTLQFKGCLDYIFYSRFSLRLVARLAAQSPTEPALVRSQGASPNELMPSDHSSLIAGFAFQPSGAVSRSADLLALPNSVLALILSLVPHVNHLRSVCRRWSILLPVLHEHVAALASASLASTQK